MAFLCALFQDTSETIGTVGTLFNPTNSLKSTKKRDIRLLFDFKFTEQASKSTQKHSVLVQFHQKIKKNIKKYSILCLLGSKNVLI
jgi:hypothetical protein